MATTFDAIFSEFSDELDALQDMANMSSSATSSSARSRIAAGNGATLLLAAIFEEYIRQQVRAAFRERTKLARSITDFPDKIAARVWRRSLEGLARIPFEEVEANIQRTDARLNATLSFCLRKEISADVSETLSHNEHNMRPTEVSFLFNQIGVQSIILKSCEDLNLMQYLGADSKNLASAVLTAKLDQFYRRRNEIAHAIQLNSSRGPSELHQDIELLRNFGQALSNTLQTNVAIELSPKGTVPSNSQEARTP